MPIRKIKLELIAVRDGRRSPGDVSGLAASMKNGLINPIVVRAADDAFELVAGGRRLAAAKMLEWPDITASVVTLSDLEARLIELDENFERMELTVLERAEHLKERKEIYESLNPETKHGAAGGTAKKRNNATVADSATVEKKSFVTDTAEKTGIAERTIREDVTIASDLDDEAKEAIRNTPIADAKTELVKLARMEPEKQVAAAKLIAEGKVETVSQAQREIAREEKRQELNAHATTPEIDADTCRIVTGDCIDGMAQIRGGSVRLVFADPPYNIGIDYGKGEGADTLPDADYLSWCQTWLNTAADLLTPDGSMWVLIGDEYADHFGLMLRKTGLYRRAWIKWFESFGVNNLNNFNRTSRHLFYCVRNENKFVFNRDAFTRRSDREMKYNDNRADPGGKIWDDVWGIPLADGSGPIPRVMGNHPERMPDFPTQLPLKLVTPIILGCTQPGDLVVDPFNGSGTTAVAAVTSGRRYTGFELNETFADLARLRVKAAIADAARTAV